MLAACASGPIQKTVPAVASRPAAPAASVEVRLQQIREEYHLMGLSFTNQQVTVCTGMQTSERMKSLQNAIHEVVGPDVKVFTIIK